MMATTIYNYTNDPTDAWLQEACKDDVMLFHYTDRC
jgi:hypothetical protein